jgi:hypothetical protein
MPGEAHYATYQDLEMLVMLGSQERIVEEYTALLGRAQFELVRVVPTQEPLSIVKAVPVQGARATSSLRGALLQWRPKGNNLWPIHLCHPNPFSMWRLGCGLPGR